MLTTTCQGLTGLPANILGNREKSTTKRTDKKKEYHREKEETLHKARETAEKTVTQDFDSTVTEFQPITLQIFPNHQKRNKIKK